MVAVPYGTPGGGTKKNKQQVSVAQKNRGNAGSGARFPDIFGLASDAFQHGGLPINSLLQQQTQAQPHRDLGGAGYLNNGRAQSQAEGYRQALADRQRRENPAPPPQAPDPSFQDFLRQALGMFGGGGDPGNIYDQQIAQAQAQGKANDAAIGQIYAGLAQDILSQTPVIGGYYDQANKEVGAQGQQAQQNIGNAYGAADAEQSARLAALGIQAPAEGFLAQGNNAANDKANALASASQVQQLDQTQNSEHKATAQTFNNRTSEGATAMGAYQRAAAQQALQKFTMGLQQQASQARTSGAQNILQQALAVASAENDDFLTRQQRQYQMQQGDFDNQAAAQKLALQQAQLQQEAGKPQRAIDLINQLLGQNAGNVSAQDYARLLSGLGGLL